MAAAEGCAPLVEEEPPIMTDIKGAVVGGSVEVEIKIQAPADAVFDFLIEPEKLLRWMGEDGTIDPRPGGEFEIRVGGDDVAVGQYVEIDRPKHLAFTWGWLGSELVPPGSSTVEINLREEGEHTVVSLVHSGLPDDQPAQHLKGWLHYGGQLGAQFDGTVG